MSPLGSVRSHPKEAGRWQAQFGPITEDEEGVPVGEIWLPDRYVTKQLAAMAAAVAVLNQREQQVEAIPVQTCNRATTPSRSVPLSPVGVRPVVEHEVALRLDDGLDARLRLRGFRLLAP